MILGGVQVSLETLKVQAFRLRAIVAVIFPLIAHEVGDSSMDGPGGVGDKEVDVLVGVPLREESETEAKGTSSRNRLGTGDPVFLTCAAILTIGESEALLDVRIDTTDGSILVVHVVLEDNFLGALYARQDEGLTVVISIGSHAKEDLLGIGVLLEGIVETEDGIRGGGRERRPRREGSLALAENLTVCTLDEAGEHSLLYKRKDRFNNSLILRRIVFEQIDRLIEN